MAKLQVCSDKFIHFSDKEVQSSSNVDTSINEGGVAVTKMRKKIKIRRSGVEVTDSDSDLQEISDA